MSKNQDSVVFKNYHLNPLLEWFDAQMLHGEESRARTKFIKILAPLAKDLEDERMKLIDDNCKKDKEGKRLMIEKEENGKMVKTFEFGKGKREKFVEEYNKALGEDAVIDILPSTKETVRLVKNILLNTNESFTGQGAVMYSEWCECFEK